MIYKKHESKYCEVIKLLELEENKLIKNYKKINRLRSHLRYYVKKYNIIRSKNT